MGILTDDELIAKIEAFCRARGIAETRFGRDAVGEASFLASLRKGRSPSLRVVNKVLAFMEADAPPRAEHDAPFQDKAA